MISIDLQRLHPPSRVRILDDVFNSLHTAILSGQLKPGERLVETTIASQLEVSRSTVREALLMLARDHLVIIRPRKGAMVTRIEPEDARDIKLNRALLESFAVRVGGDSLDSMLLHGLESRLVAMQQCTLPKDLPHIVEIDLDFHRLLVNLAESDRLLSLWSSLNGQIGALMLSSVERKHLLASDLIGLHQVLIESVRAGNLQMLQRAIVEHYIGDDGLDVSKKLVMSEVSGVVAEYIEKP